MCYRAHPTNSTIECDREPASTEGKLLKKLLCGRYDKSQRPVKNDTTVMDIQSSMFVRNYDLVRDVLQSLSLYVWMTLTWKDEWLTWDRSEFDMEKVMIDSDELWQPTLISYTDKQDGSMKSACTDHMCEVKYNGEVNCIPPCKYGAICKNDIANWPFDIQNCSLIIGTQLEKSTAIRFNNPPKMSTSFEMDHPEWKLLSSNISTGDLSENSNIREAEYIFVLERHVAIYSAILTPGVFALKCDGEPSTKEGILQKKLFCSNYDKSERPVKDHNTAVNISATLHLQNYDVSERKSTLNLFVWMTFIWRDEFLSWDRAEYGIDKLIVDATELWQPTFIAFHNLKSGSGDTACSGHRCEVNQTGHVLCVPPCQYEALCISDTMNWPFDKLKCTMFLGVWLEHVGQINISKTSNVSPTYINLQHAEWKIQSAITLYIFLPDNTSYPSLEFVFTLERHTAIYGVILAPGLLLLIINFVVLWMNSRSNERLYILCATCMAHFSYMEYLYWRVPYNGESVPTTLLFFRNSLIINAFMLAFTIVLRHAETKPINSERWVDKLALRCASTSFGRVFLQADDFNVAKEQEVTSDDGTGNADDNRSSNADGDTVNLVVDTSDNTDPATPTEHIVRQHHVVITFMDRMLFVGCVLSYPTMLYILMPNANIM
ncbi:neuronal acetylcholine receptor subunit beta-3-like [Anopheles nili]|uniref:neuronal acetylcholine receptor subunit beta-3-like n=1 Tax=Anopheles nili TaxID=185578 RepID=UPI00237B85F4|nr:neuronal acetylcholine receptor subunit beta-3-like [Anopheles nili]